MKEIAFSIVCLSHIGFLTKYLVNVMKWTKLLYSPKEGRGVPQTMPPKSSTQLHNIGAERELGSEKGLEVDGAENLF